MRHRGFCVLAVTIAFAAASRAAAQPTTFTYQGRLSDTGAPANGSFDLVFDLYDTPDTGTGNHIAGPVGLTTTVTNGIFTVSLDFGGNAFTGADRYLEIVLRPSGTTLFTLLSPRQRIGSSPYALRAIAAAAADTAVNTAQLGGVAASQYVLTGDSRLSDARPPAAGSTNYIQNTPTPQPGATFSIGGDGYVNGTLFGGTVNSAFGYQLGGVTILANPGTNNFFAGQGTGQSLTTGTANTFVGATAGTSNSSATQNTFVGSQAGNQTSTGGGNSFFGAQAGKQNIAGLRNSFFGGNAGLANTLGGDNSYFGANAGAQGNGGSLNSFFGSSAGLVNSLGFFNSFFGAGAGQANTTGSYNAFFGWNTGSFNSVGQENAFFGTQSGPNTVGSNNVFVGTATGANNQSGNNNTLVGDRANVSTGTLQYAGAIGARAFVSNSNSLVLGSINGVNGATASMNVGIGTTAPTARLHVVGDGLITGNLTVSGTLTATLAGGGTSYIQNTTTQQASSNFNISGNGTAGGTLSGDVVNAATQYNVGGNRILFTNAGGDSLFAGFSSGGYNTGTQNTFLGVQAGGLNDAGSRNVFIGFQAGETNTTGTSNTALGRRADVATNSLDHATAIGAESLVSANNTIVLGRSAGQDTVQIPGNLTVTGTISGNVPGGSTNYIQNTTTQQGSSNFNISGNGVVGTDLSVAHNVSIGGSETITGNLVSNGFGVVNGAVVATGPALFDSGVNVVGGLTVGGTVTTSGSGTFGGSVGIGTTSPEQALQVDGQILSTGAQAAVSFRERGSASSSDDWFFYAYPQGLAHIAALRHGFQDVWSVDNSGTFLVNLLRLGNSSGGGQQSLCRDADNFVGDCSSSLRYKTNVAPFNAGLGVILQFRPITFQWKAGGASDVGFGAEDVERIDPRFVTYNKEGQVEGVKYDRLTTVLVNAIREQQAQIDRLLSLVCADHPDADVCRRPE